MDIGKWDILGLIVIGLLVYAVVASVYISSEESSVQSNREINKSLSAEEKAQLEKSLALEKDPEFLTAINHFVKSIDRESPPVRKNLIVENMTSDTEAEVYLSVVHSTANGDRVLITYHGNWTKDSGVWKAEDNFK